MPASKMLILQTVVLSRGDATSRPAEATRGQRTTGLDL
jgi:hypothetical protein